MVLAILVLFVSDRLFGPKQGPVRTAITEMSDSTSVPASGTRSGSPDLSAVTTEPASGTFDSMAAAAPSEEMVNQLLTANEPEEITIAGAKYQATLSRRGGVVSSFILAEYTDAENQPANLIRDEEKGVLGLTIETPDGILDLAETEFHVETRKSGGMTRVEFSAEDANGVRVTKTYLFHPDSLAFRLQLKASGIPNGDGAARYGINWGEGMPLLEVKPAYDQAGMASVALIGKDFVKDGGASMRGMGCSGGGGKKDQWEFENHDGMIHWAGVRDKYFLGAIIPENALDARVRTERNSGRNIARTQLIVPVDLDGTVARNFMVYLGPLKHNELQALGVGLERAVDLGMKPIIPISRLVLWCMTTLYKVIPNYGIVILIVSVLAKILMYPLTKKSLNSMKKMQLVKPEMDEINKKYKDDPQKKQKAMMALYKEHSINPVGGCLPMVLQMPIFFALYSVLYNVIEMRKAPFVFWIKDLSLPDNVGNIMGVPINPLPVIMTATMIWQQKLTPTDPRQATMAMIMPIMFLFFFYNLPSGLVFYWTVNNVVSVIQQLWIKRGDKPVSSGKGAERRDYAVASKG